MTPDPIYGRQLQTAATPGHPPEAVLRVSYADEPVTLSDGTVVDLRRPSYLLNDLAYGPMHAGAALSPRVAPPMIGLGLLQAIPGGQILGASDPEDRDGDGISGRANILSENADGSPVIGRFGWARVATHRARPSGGRVPRRYRHEHAGASRALWRLHGASGTVPSGHDRRGRHRNRGPNDEGARLFQPPCRGAAARNRGRRGVRPGRLPGLPCAASRIA